MTEQPATPTLQHRVLAAAAASVLSAVLVTPLDVVKVQDLDPSVLRSSRRCLESTPFQPATSSGVLRDIVRKEGLAALWRGTDTAILASIPMVGVYMPLYDHLLSRTAPALGPYAPVVAGSVARTLAVLLVGPLELVRTRQQGGSSGASNAWAALRDTLRETAAGGGGAAAASGSAAPVGQAAEAAAERAASGSAAGSSGRAAGAAVGSAPRLAAGGALRGVARMWTGAGATLWRDVPFSALYWGLVEPIRGGVLRRYQQQHEQLHAQLQGAARAGAGGRGDAAATGAGAGAGADVGEHRVQQLAPPYQPSGREVLAANLLAGSTAGALSAVVTTPFDVVKTRLQVGDVRQARSSVGVLRDVVRTEGVGGLFRGWVPRAARTAPACAVVIASYEVLKLLV